MKITEVHSSLRSKKVFVFFTWFTRILLCLAFLPSGLKKVLGLRFTNMGIENTVGFFFEALYRTGFYWMGSTRGRDTDPYSTNLIVGSNYLFADCNKYSCYCDGNEFYRNANHSLPYVARQPIPFLLGVATD